MFSGLSSTVGFFKTLSLPSFSHYQLAFSGGKEGQT